MKKLLMVLLILVLAFAAISCENNTVSEEVDNSLLEENNVEVTEDVDVSEEADVSEDTVQDETTDSIEDELTEALTLDEIVTQMYEATGLEFPKTMISPLTSENMAYMLGVDNFDYLEGIASEPMMSSQAHSIVLFTVEEGSDIETIKADIKANVDGRKWICVGVEEENIIVENAGNTIVLIMDINSEALMSAFEKIMN